MVVLTVEADKRLGRQQEQAVLPVQRDRREKAV